MSKDLGELLAKLDDLGGNIEEALEAGVKKACQEIQARAKLLAPVDNGQLRAGIVVNTKVEDGDIIGTVGTNVPYAAYVEFGTGPVGNASPKTAPEGLELRYRTDGWTYFDPKTQEFVYTLGQPARPYLYPAFKQSEGDVAELIAKELRRAIKGAQE